MGMEDACSVEGKEEDKLASSFSCLGYDYSDKNMQQRTNNSRRRDLTRPNSLESFYSYIVE